MGLGTSSINYSILSLTISFYFFTNKVCPEGYYCDSLTTSEADMKANKKCPKGKYCGPGLKDLSESHNCEKGHYCPEGEIFFEENFFNLHF